MKAINVNSLKNFELDGVPPFQSSRARRILADKRRQMSEEAHKKIKADEFLTPPLNNDVRGEFAKGESSCRMAFLFRTFLWSKQRKLHFKTP
jgi:hypothetical protein